MPQGGIPIRNPDSGLWYIQVPRNGDFPGSITGEWIEVAPSAEDACGINIRCENVIVSVQGGSPIRNPDSGIWYVQVPRDGDFPGSIAGEWVEADTPVQNSCGFTICCAENSTTIATAVQGGAPIRNPDDGRWYIEVPRDGDFPGSIAGEWVEVDEPDTDNTCESIACCEDLFSYHSAG